MKEGADAIDRAIARVVKEGRARTYDMGGTTTTSGMAEAIAAAIA